PWVFLDCAYWTLASLHSLKPDEIVHAWARIRRVAEQYVEDKSVCSFYINYLESEIRLGDLTRPYDQEIKPAETARIVTTDHLPSSLTLNMDLKLVLFAVILLLSLHQQVQADFFYNRVLPKQEELGKLGLKCVPGRTMIKIEQPAIKLSNEGGSDELGSSENYLRSHMNFQTDDASCQMCMCSVEGKDEYCSKRPAKNVNECIRMAALMANNQKNEPFEHEKSLFNRIRRDYLWHNDEIPYNARAKCPRGHSYYSNSLNANNSDIDLPSDVESLLDYGNKSVCSYCVCSMAGDGAGCMSKSPWFCEYYRVLREGDAPRDMYNELFQQDRPAYFRSLSWRLRRTMDNGIFDLVHTGGDALCCDHPNGHRRHLHHQIRNKIRLLKRKVNKENLMSGAPHTLKNQNLSGTIAAQKVDMLPQISRRTSVLNKPTLNSVKIEYTKPREDIHRDDNKVDTPAIHDDKEDLIIHSNIYNSMGNQSQEGKDKELSKILVNELKGGFTETIGDKTAPVISNITFTPENDTLTAMAFIAGNLLNKLWQMEKDTSDDHFDTEILIQEKNSDLLELFKEPLNMRQELFLKNTLEQLSTALNHNKNVENISLCKKVEEVKTLIFGKKEDKRIRGGWRVNSEDKTNCNKSNQGNEVNQNTATVEALKKINNVLDLIKKYEIVKNSLSNMKYGKVHDNSLFNLDKAITNDEKLSLDLYGHTLETITKLLLPNKSNKKIVKSIKNCNLFSSEKDLRNKLSGIKLGDMNLTTKDRIVLDYLAHIQSNPNCLLKKQNDKISRPSIEGNILLNLSEFFKIKSLSDLVKLVEEEKPPVPVFRTQDFTTQKSVKEQTTQSIKKDSSIKFQEIKEKLKGHLQFILEDLIALQKVEGKGTTGKDIQIMKALPCIYTILNAGKKEIKTPNIYETTTTPVDVSPPGKIQEIFSNLRKELKLAQTRRTSNFSGPRPKSAVVWERVIKNADGKQKLKTRRLLGKAPKTIEELKEIMDKIEMSSGSNMYKNIAYLNEVPPTERLLLLKTLNAETLRYITILEKIYTLPAMSDLPKESVKELNEFFDNVAMNVMPENRQTFT
ncbi:Uncharacterized protein OBRU01_15686, partial [Operophtera brumata]